MAKSGNNDITSQTKHQSIGLHSKQLSAPTCRTTTHEIAPKKSMKTSGSQARMDSRRSDGTSLDASQELDVGSVQEIMNQHKQRVRLIRLFRVIHSISKPAWILVLT